MMNKPFLILKDTAGSLIIDECGNTLSAAEKPLELLNQRCLKHGSDINGRIASFRSLLGIKQKAAVLISEINDEIWFPTLSMKQKDCVWIRYDALMSVKAEKPNECDVISMKGFSYHLDTDRRVINEQMKRCRRFLDLLHREE